MKRISKFQAFWVRFVYGAQKKGFWIPILTSKVDSWVVKKFNFFFCLSARIHPDDLYEGRGLDVLGSCDGIAHYGLKFLAQDLSKVFEVAQKQIGMSPIETEIIKAAKAVFWNAHLLAKSIDISVHKSWKQYLAEN